jgi:hypothetical protein
MKCLRTISPSCSNASERNLERASVRLGLARGLRAITTQDLPAALRGSGAKHRLAIRSAFRRAAIARACDKVLASLAAVPFFLTTEERLTVITINVARGDNHGALDRSQTRVVTCETSPHTIHILRCVGHRVVARVEAQKVERVARFLAAPERETFRIIRAFARAHTTRAANNPVARGHVRDSDPRLAHRRNADRRGRRRIFASAPSRRETFAFRARRGDQQDRGASFRHATHLEQAIAKRYVGMAPLRGCSTLDGGSTRSSDAISMALRRGRRHEQLPATSNNPHSKHPKSESQNHRRPL